MLSDPGTYYVLSELERRLSELLSDVEFDRQGVKTTPSSKPLTRLVKV
jgi:hypothetical protein